MTGIRESSVEAACVDLAVADGWLELKIAKSNRRGWPDRLFVKHGVYVWVEFKKLDKPPNRQQEKRHDELRAAGGAVLVIDKVENFMWYLTATYDAVLPDHDDL